MGWGGTSWEEKQTRILPTKSLFSVVFTALMNASELDDQQGEGAGELREGRNGPLEIE